MKIRSAVIAASGVLCFSVAQVVLADDPDLQFGMWETTVTTSMESAQFSVPATSSSSTDCVTREDFDKGVAFVQDPDNCSMTEQDLRSDGADYTMSCNMPEMGEMVMTMSMKFMNDTMSGVMKGNIDSPMGPMTMTVDMEGKRIGDC